MITGLILLAAASGLFGLMVYMVKRHTREAAIEKARQERERQAVEQYLAEKRVRIREQFLQNQTNSKSIPSGKSAVRVKKVVQPAPVAARSSSSDSDSSSSSLPTYTDYSSSWSGSSDTTSSSSDSSSSSGFDAGGGSFGGGGSDASW